MRDISSAIVSGPTGAVGMALVSLLVRRGVDVWAVVRPGSARAERLNTVPGVVVVECDLSALADLPKLLKGVRADAFFHLGWEGTIGAARNDVDAQLKNVQHAIAACRAASCLGCSVFVGGGSQAEYGPCDVPLAPATPCFPQTGYGIAKLCAGQMTRLECMRLGLAHMWVRILSVYGPWDGEQSMIMSTIRALLAVQRPSLTAGEQLWDFLYAEDAACGLLNVAERGESGAVYPLGSGGERPIKEYVDVLRDAIDPSLPLGVGEIPYAKGQQMRLVADISSLRQDVGFEPRTSFEQGIQATIAWAKEHPYG